MRNTVILPGTDKLAARVQGVDAVLDDMHCTCAGYGGKKQPIVVSTGGPALRTRAHLGGQ